MSILEYACTIWNPHTVPRKTSLIYGTAQFKLDIYMRVTCDFMDKSLVSLASYTQVVNKFVLLLTSCMRALNKFVEPFASSMQAHDLMNL